MSAFRSARAVWAGSPRTRALGIDLGLAVAVAIVVDVTIAVATEPGSRPPDALAYALGAAMGAPVLGRRRWPLGALAATAVLLLAYYSLNYPGLPPAIPLAVVLYSAAAAGRLRWTLAVAGFFVLAGLVALGVHRREPPPLVFISMVQVAMPLAALALLGEVVRSRGVRLAEAAERLRWAEAEREREAARRVAEDRLRIARELHDVLAHTTTAITVQAQVAAEALGDRPEQVRAALDAIRSAGRDAMAELKATVGVLRADGVAPRAPEAGLAQLEELLALARDAGVRAEAAVTGEPRPLPAAVDRAGYRIVQEALTNVVRHANASRVTVVIGYRPDALAIEVTDDGVGAAPAAVAGRGGHGITGMTERATALRGSLRAGPAPDGGFRVRATLPTGEVSP